VWSQKDHTTLHVIKKSCESKRVFQGYDITEFSVITKNNQLLLTRQETKCLHFRFAFAAKRDSHLAYLNIKWHHNSLIWCHELFLQYIILHLQTTVPIPAVHKKMYNLKLQKMNFRIWFKVLKLNSDAKRDQTLMIKKTSSLRQKFWS